MKGKQSKLNGKGNGNAAQTNSRTVDEFVQEITASYQRGVSAIIETGRLLILAKQQHPGQFHAKIKTKLPFGERAVQKLMKIAEHKVLCDPTHVSALPASWGTLAELARIDDARLEKMLNEGTVHAGIERSEVDLLINEDKEYGVYQWPGARDAIDTLIGFKNKWRPDSLVCELNEKDHGEEGLPDASNLLNLSKWLAEFSAALKVVEDDDDAAWEAFRKKCEAEDKGRIRTMGGFRIYQPPVVDDESEDDEDVAPEPDAKKVKQHDLLDS